MVKKISGYTLIFIGILCFLVVGGGSMRYRSMSYNVHGKISEDIVAIIICIALPVLGFFMIKFGLGMVDRNKT